MKSKKVRRLSAMLMAGAMMVATLGMNVCAANEDALSLSVPVTKIVEADNNVLAPNTTFKFKIESGTAVNADASTNQPAIYAGPERGAFFYGANNTHVTETELSFSPDSGLTKSTNINFDMDLFNKPGIYRYIISEIAPESNAGYDGITYSTQTYTMDVYVVDNVNTTDIDLSIDGVTINNVPFGLNTSNTGKTSGITFNNTYSTHNLTVTKMITGNQADNSAKFKFYITINGAAGEQYKLVQGNTSSSISSGQKVEVELGKDESVIIYGLSANDTYTIAETNYSSDGYTTTAQLDNTTDLNENKKDGENDTDDTNYTTFTTQTMGNSSHTVTVTNNKNVTTPTGIITTIAPFAIMVILAAAVAVVFLRRRNRAEF